MTQLTDAVVDFFPYLLMSQNDVDKNLLSK